MRSATPKLLHEVCGRAIIAWPVAAARAAGAGKVVVVEGPDRPLQASLDGEVTVAVQQEPRGTADAVKAAAAYIGPSDTVIVLNGDHPLITAGHARRAGARRMPSRARRRRWRPRCSMTRAGTDGSCGRRTARSSASSRRRRPGDATEIELRIREISTGIFAFEGAALIAALDEVRSDNAQGELYLPDVLQIMRAHRAERPRLRDQRRQPNSASTTGWDWRRSGRWRSAGSTSATCSPGSRSSTRPRP